MPRVESFFFYEHQCHHGNKYHFHVLMISFCSAIGLHVPSFYLEKIIKTFLRIYMCRKMQLMSPMEKLSSKPFRYSWYIYCTTRRQYMAQIIKMSLNSLKCKVAEKPEVSVRQTGSSGFPGNICKIVKVTKVQK